MEVRGCAEPEHERRTRSEKRERHVPPTYAPGYRVNRNAPRVDDNTSVLPASVMVLSPLNKLVYACSNAIVGHAARVHANAGPAVRVSPDTANPPLQTLQSTRVESRPSANDNV